MTVSIVTGITGQDGAYLTKFLLEKNHKVIGTFRRSASTNFWRLDELGIANHENLELVGFDLMDMGTSIRMLERFEPDEIYNLAAQSFVATSFDQPHKTSQINGIGVLNLLEAVRTVNRNIRIYQASTSEMFGLVQEVPQRETTPFYPRSPYGIAKLYAHWMIINYRESYDIFATSGILFNHESPLRGQEFVTRKITNTVSKIMLGKADILELGNMDAKRDWGYAGEFVEGMYRILHHDVAETFVLATGRTETVRSFVELSFKAIGTNINWEGSGENEVGKDDNGKILVKVNPQFYRPAEVELLVGDASKAKNALGWEPKTTLEELCSMMVEADIKRNKQGFSF